MGKVVKFLHLSGPEKLLFFRAAYLLFYYRIALRRQHFQTLIERLLGAEEALYHTAEPMPVETVLRLFAAACRIVPCTTCLSRAMAGQRLLNGYGHVPVFHIGVAREQALEAHAWLSLDGDLIVGNIPELERYRELPPLHTGWSEKR